MFWGAIRFASSVHSLVRIFISVAYYIPRYDCSKCFQTHTRTLKKIVWQCEITKNNKLYSLIQIIFRLNWLGEIKCHDNINNIRSLWLFFPPSYTFVMEYAWNERQIQRDVGNSMRSNWMLYNNTEDNICTSYQPLYRKPKFRQYCSTSAACNHFKFLHTCQM
jgi:hypothetical protein